MPIESAETKFHLHLVSDATGETIHSVARACLAQFEGVEPIEHNWALIRTPGQIDKLLAEVERNPGVVMFTVVNERLRHALLEGCRRLQVPCIAVLDPVIASLGNFLGIKARGQPGRQHIMDAEYFGRIDAMTFALHHDDGQSPQTLTDADIVLVGVSRTSKTPTCIYLANRGIKAANVPIVPGVPLPAELQALRNRPGEPFVVGLTKDPGRLVQVRRHRLHMLSQDANTDYVDLEAVRAEVMHARKLFARQGWPAIDVTRRSIEESAAAILQLY
ncbi:MAG TPA: kinase/pyrophosphorylase, partial [Alphaproteobacteria bacterium]|nr:kinase/pyrophosphorylase [Alphaproteobacteria bacterium]